MGSTTISLLPNFHLFRDPIEEFQTLPLRIIFQDLELCLQHFEALGARMDATMVRIKLKTRRDFF